MWEEAIYILVMVLIVVVVAVMIVAFVNFIKSLGTAAKKTFKSRPHARKPEIYKEDDIIKIDKGSVVKSWWLYFNLMRRGHV